MDSTRRTLRTTGAAAVAAASAPRAFAQATDKGQAARPFYERGGVRIHYQYVGSGFPLLIIPGGGQNATIAWAEKNAPSGRSSGPLEIGWPWDTYSDDPLGPMGHLLNKRFTVLGFCIGGPTSRWR